MAEQTYYAVHLFPQALEMLGECIKPYLHEAAHGPQIICTDVDTGGAFVELALIAKNSEGESVDIELMIPAQMIRVIVSVKSEEAFGFGAG